jgi:hypothetical protein
MNTNDTPPQLLHAEQLMDHAKRTSYRFGVVAAILIGYIGTLLIWVWRFPFGFWLAGIVIAFALPWVANRYALRTSLWRYLPAYQRVRQCFVDQALKIFIVNIDKHQSQEALQECVTLKTMLTVAEWRGIERKENWRIYYDEAKAIVGSNADDHALN